MAKQVDFFNSNSLHFNIEKAGNVTIGSGGTTSNTVTTAGDLPSVGEEGQVYVIETENATYRWDSATMKYYCCGRDYEEIMVLSGGDSTSD